MSTTQFVLNRAMLVTMQKTQFCGLLPNGNLIRIGLAKPEIAGKRVIESGKLATKQNHCETLENLPSDAMLEFTIEIIAPIVRTSFQHELLATQNQTAQEYNAKFTAYANLNSLELSETSFLGDTLDSALIHSLVKTYVKQSKSENSISRKWKKAKGKYQVKDNGNWVDYALPTPKPESPESMDTQATS